MSGAIRQAADESIIERKQSHLDGIEEMQEEARQARRYLENELGKTTGPVTGHSRHTMAIKDNVEIMARGPVGVYQEMVEDGIETPPRDFADDLGFCIDMQDDMVVYGSISDDDVEYDVATSREDHEVRQEAERIEAELNRAVAGDGYSER